MADATAVEAPPAAPVMDVEPPKGYEEAFGAIDALGREEGTPTPPGQPPPGDGRVRGADGKFIPKDKAVEKSAPKAEPAKAEPPKPDDDIDPTKLKTSELAKHYHKLKAEQKEWLKAKEDYEKKLKTPPEWPEKKTYEERLAEREKKIEEYNKRVADYEQTLQFTNFTKSQHYKDTFEKPYVESWKTGQSRAASMKVIERKNEEDGSVIQQARQGTVADFDSIMSIAEDDLAAEKATELFGNKASIILHHREKIRDIQSRADAAIEEYRQKGTEWEKTNREQVEKQSKEYTSMVDKFQKAAVEKYPALFKPDDSDPKGNELLAKGSHLLERVLKNGAPVADGEQQMSGEEYAIAVAAVRNKAMGFDRVAYLASTRGKRIKELEKELEQFKASKPANGNGNGRTAAAEPEDPMSLIDKMGREA
jgi:hypothetical protein